MNSTSGTGSEYSSLCSCSVVTMWTRWHRHRSVKLRFNAVSSRKYSSTIPRRGQPAGAWVRLAT